MDGRALLAWLSALALLGLAGCHTDPGPNAPPSGGPARPAVAPGAAPAGTTVVTVSNAPEASTAPAGAPRGTDADDTAWQDALAAGQGNGAGTCAGIGPVRAYLERYPKGKHADEARRLLPEYERSCRELQSGIAKGTPWVERQKERQAAFLAVQQCASACKSDTLCQDHCGTPPLSKARCVACTLNGRCQILTSGDAPGQLDCCLPMTDESNCIKPKSR